MSLRLENTLTLEVASTYEALDLVVEEAQVFLATRKVEADLAYNVVLLLSEAVTNAMEHGNGWDARLKVAVTISVHANHIEVSAQDEGPGFDASAHPDPFAEHNMLKDGGRGRFLMRKLADELFYEEGGRRVRMVFLTPK